jgi:hypothetical protein
MGAGSQSTSESVHQDRDRRLAGQDLNQGFACLMVDCLTLLAHVPEGLQTLLVTPLSHLLLLAFSVGAQPGQRRKLCQ